MHFETELRCSVEGYYQFDATQYFTNDSASKKIRGEIE